MAGAQGFASMDDKKQRKIAKMGGEASHGGGNKSAGARTTGTSARGAAGKTGAAKRGGENSHRS
jgi:hypothetical protein